MIRILSKFSMFRIKAKIEISNHIVEEPGIKHCELSRMTRNELGFVLNSRDGPCLHIIQPAYKFSCLYSTC